MCRKSVTGLRVVLACLLGLSSSLSQMPELPKSLGRLKLTKTLEGHEAQAFVDQLHQKAVAPKRSVTGEYQAGSLAASLYVSTYKADREAREAGDRMTRLIRGGNRVFGHYSEEVRSSVRVGRCVGMGQIHYLFRQGPRLFWLGADPAVSEEALDYLLRSVTARMIR